MARKLTIPYYRPTFVEKTIGEVGDGTAWPMGATLDQVAEIFYRVKDAKFIEGNIGVRVNDPELPPAPDFIAEIVSPTDTTSNKTAYSNYLSRGYTTGVGDEFVGIDPQNEPFLLDEYDAGSGAMCRDIADDELGMFTLSILPDWNSLYTGFVTAFSFRQEGGGSIYSTNPEHVFVMEWYFTPVEDPGDVNYLDAYASVVFSGEVAVVKASTESDIIDAANQYFIGLEFRANSDFTVSAGFVEFSTNLDSLTGAAAQVPNVGVDAEDEYCQYVIRLAPGDGSNDIKCPIYLDYADTYFTAGENFIHEATEWWPYDDGEGNPVWDTLTGAKL